MVNVGLLVIKIEEPYGATFSFLAGSDEPGRPVQTMGSLVLRMRRQCQFFAIREVSPDVINDGTHGGLAISTALDRTVDQEVEHLGLRAGMGNGDDPHQGVTGINCKRLPLQATDTNVGFCKNLKGNRFVFGHEL